MAILIAEDNPVNAQLLILTLKANGYQTVLARNGMEALASLEGKEPIDLIITDFQMPEMTGLELITKIRELPAFKDIPIVIASAHSDLETVTNAKSLRCDGFLTKPIDKKMLLKKVKELVETEPPVLRSKQYILQKLGISPEEYDSLAIAFAAQLATTLPIVILEQSDSKDTISKNLSQLLDELAESAVILGADKFHRVYQRINANSLPIRSQCPLLQHSLQELENAVNASTKSSPRTDAKN